MNKDLTPMTADDFHEKMRLIDAELSQKGVPVYERSFQAFPIAAPDYNGPLMSSGIDSSEYGEYEGPNLLGKIHNWYKQIYGKRASAARDLGRIPIIIKDDTYLVRLPLVYEIPEINILPFVDGLTPAVARRLSAAELNEIRNKFIEGYTLTRKFEDLYSQLEAEETNGTKRKSDPFLDSAMQDKDAAVDCLDEELDTNGAVFHSQQLTEKMLNAVLFHFNGMSEEDINKKYKHRIIDIYKAISGYAKFPARIISELNFISRYKLSIKDAKRQVSSSDAVKAFWSGLRIGGFCATLLSGYKKRVQSLPITSTKEESRMKRKGSEAKPARQMPIEEMLAPFEALRVGVLATVEEGRPYTSIIAFALTPDRRTLLFTTSSSTRKYRNIISQPAVSILLDNRSQSAGDINSAQAVTLLGTAKKVRAGAKKEQYRAIFVNRHPELADFIDDPGTALIAFTLQQAVHVARFEDVSVWP